jgi:hypothetical protein
MGNVGQGNLSIIEKQTFLKINLGNFFSMENGAKFAQKNAFQQNRFKNQVPILVLFVRSA